MVAEVLLKTELLTFSGGESGPKCEIKIHNYAEIYTKCLANEPVSSIHWCISVYYLPVELITISLT